MRKAKDIIGLPVLAFRSGRRLPEVKDILFDPAQNRVLALLVDEGGWFDTADVIPFDRIKAIGDDAVIVEDERAIIEASRNREINRALHQDRVITRVRAFTEDGRDLGTIGDMFLDEQTGEVVGYEVTGGVFADTLHGKRFMPAPATMSLGKEVSFVPSDVGDEMEQQVTGGIQKTVSEAGERGREVAAQAREVGGEVSERAKAGAERLTRMSSEQQRSYVIGKRASNTVKTPDGRVIVRSGDKISRSDADEAERYGLLTQLALAVGGAQARGAGGEAQQGAGQAFEDIRSTVGGWTRGFQEDTEQRRINSAIGLPVNRVILDHDDHVILNTGEIITFDAVRRAREAGVLDVLLSSASRGQPSFGLDQRKAHEPGESSLDQEHGHQSRK